MSDQLTVIDVGARGGPHSRWTKLPVSVHVVGFDPDESECARLNQRSWPVPTTFLPYALGAVEGENATLHVTRQPGCSSLLRPNDAYLAAFPYAQSFEVVRTVPVSLTTLDIVCRERAFVPDVLKVDVQGYELEVLRGATDALSSTSLVELEVEFNPLYQNQPLFGDLDAELRRVGFTLLGLRRTAWRRNYEGPSLGGTIVHGDALWVREPTDPAGRRRFAWALLAYRQYDYARQLGVIPSDAHMPFWKRALGGSLGMAAPHRDLRGWLDQTRGPGASDWHDPDFF